MRREERVTVQGPVKEQQPDGMSHRGYEGKNKVVCLNWTSHFGLSIQLFIFPRRKNWLVFGGWVVWPGVRVSFRSTPPPAPRSPPLPPCGQAHP